jgi:hypothetical protein
VLGGTLSALGGIGPEDLAVKPLLARIEGATETVREVILALPATVDGATTAHYLTDRLRPAGVAVTLVSPGFVDTEIHQVDNHGVRHPEVRHRAPAWVRMSAERAARLIVRAVARRRREVVITWLGRLTVFVGRHLPWLYAWAARTFGARARPEPSRVGADRP